LNRSIGIEIENLTGAKGCGQDSYPGMGGSGGMAREQYL